MNPPTKGYTMKIKKPSRKTVNDVAAATAVVGATAATLVVGLKVQKVVLEHSLLKTQLTMAYTLIKKTEELHPQAIHDAVEACNKELLEALITHTS